MSSGGPTTPFSSMNTPASASEIRDALSSSRPSGSSTALEMNHVTGRRGTRTSNRARSSSGMSGGNGARGPRPWKVCGPAISNGASAPSLKRRSPRRPGSAMTGVLGMKIASASPLRVMLGRYACVASRSMRTPENIFSPVPSGLRRERNQLLTPGKLSSSIERTGDGWVVGPVPGFGTPPYAGEPGGIGSGSSSPVPGCVVRHQRE